MWSVPFEHVNTLSRSLCGSTALVDIGRFFSFVILYTVGRTPWTGDQPVARKAVTYTE
jgi:hypothetical protein